MKLSELRSRIKLQVPNANQGGLSDTDIDAILNKACDQVNLITKVYKTYTDFDIVADQSVYALSTYVPLYLGTDKRGLFMRDSSGNWQYVIPKTLGWVSERYPDFLNDSSVRMPRWYWIDGDNLELSPPPSTAYTKGARLYHLRKSNPMTSGDHYPFTGSTTEITVFGALDDAIVAYAKWKISPAFGKVTDEDLRRSEFIDECRRGAMQIKRRKDLANDSSYRITV